ncbi:MAG: DUF2085 domain-containing protein [Anaerolineae bacterium]|nr:DUF2085 domain-containing protein [Anaerolineae bacterium]
MSDYSHPQPVSDTLKRQRIIRTWRALLWGLDHWVLIFSILFGVANVLPVVAPVLMHIGWTGPGRLIYVLYSPMCHQMAQRSFFLFGQQPMYNLTELPLSLTGNTATDMTMLRSFLGSPALGWKVAWSDRMVYMYGAALLAGIAFAVLRQRRPVRPLGLLPFALLLMPITLDGATHLLSDFNGGLVAGFRYHNQWLSDLTGNALPTWFYVGDTFGSFNSWMRLISGLAFGLGCVWLAFPYVDHAISETAAELRTKLARAQQLRLENPPLDKGSA